MPNVRWGGPVGEDDGEADADTRADSVVAEHGHCRHRGSASIHVCQYCQDVSRRYKTD
jgi:hypothetical protein